ncbi:GntR family transcriptional regulator [Oceanibacterium hippocampi]|uniref:Putative HTH-type transcriptional regulator YdfH n=1 Tax=Oceanibacterium hippocampi TaxID=745714 RepID=A0A1Y5S2N6_9PROT|nr:GntR family transcriptional regulator [Oceanibacterium hippocampi]SLN30937.1 putative HTH-type transcriptional regulator YdfH [Oceanibacterium hippocampi]
MRPLDAKPDLTMQTHAAIRAAIMSGDLAPSAPLTQEDLAGRLGVSRQPISHALILLKREGLVVDRGRKGQMVAPIDADRLLALYQVRGALDGLAARLAAGHAGDGCARQLDTLIADGRAAAAKRDIGALVAADVAFHQALQALSGNAEIAGTAEGFWPHMARSMRVVLEDADGWAAIWDEHAAIAGAVIAGDAAGAATLATRHAEHAGETTHRRLTSD